MLDQRILEQLEQQESSSPEDSGAPQMVRPSAPVAPAKKKSIISNIPGRIHDVQKGTEDAQAEAILKKLDNEMGYLPEDPAAQPVQQTAEAAGFWRSAWNVMTSAPKGITLGMLQLGQDITNTSKEMIQELQGKRQAAQKLPSFLDGEGAATQMWAKTSKVMAPITAGAAAGTAILPGVGTVIGGVAGAALAAFTQDPTDENLSTVLQDTRLKDWPVVGDVINKLAHKPGDMSLDRRIKNLTESVGVDVGLSGVAAGAASVTPSLRRAGKALADEYNGVKNYILKKYPAQQSVEDSAARVASTDFTKEMPAMRQTMPDEQVAAKAGVTVADNTAKELNDVAAKLDPEELEKITVAEQKDPMLFVSHLEELNKAKVDSDLVKQFEAEKATKEFSEREITKQQNIFMDRPPVEGDPRLSKEQLSLFDVDDTDIAGFSYDPKQASFFEKNYELSLPAQFDPPEDQLIKETFEAQKTPGKPVVVKEADPPNVIATFADETVVEKLDRLSQIRATYYANKAASQAGIPREVAIGEAAAKLKNPTYKKYILNLPEGHVPNEVEMAASQQLYVEAFVEMDSLATKVVAGTANDLELQAYQESVKNFFYISSKYLGQGTDLSRAFGVRTMLREYAKAGNPIAIKAIGNEGKMKAVKALLQSAGGRDTIEQEAEVFTEFLKAASKPKGTLGEITAGGQTFKRDFVENVVDRISNIMKTNDSNYFLDAAAEVQLKSRGRRLLDSYTGFLFDNMLLHYAPLVNSAFGVVPDVGMRLGTNYTMALLAGLRGKGLEAALRFDKANTYALSLAKNIGLGLRAAAREYALGAPGKGDIIISSGAKVPQYLQELAQQTLVDTAQQALKESSALKSFASQAYGWTIGQGRKLLSSWDAFMHTIGYNARLESELRHQGLRSGLQGPFLDNFVAQGMKAPSPELHSMAMLDGAKFGYRADLELPILQFGEEALHKFPAMKLFVPFFRSYGNSVERTLEYFPGLAYMVKGGTTSQEELLAKQMVGGGALLLSAMAFRGGHLENPELPKAYYQNFLEPNEVAGNKGKIPLGLKGSNGWTKLPLGGAIEKYLKMAGYLNMAADYMSEDEYQATFRAATLAAGSLFSAQEQFRAADTLWEMIKDPNSATSQMERLGASFVERSIPGYRIMKEFNNQEGFAPAPTLTRASDPIDYVTSVLKNRIQAIVPGLNEDVPPQVNILGEFVNTNLGIGAPNLFTGTDKSSQVMEKLIALAEFGALRPNGGYESLSISKPPDVLDINGFKINLTDKQYAKYKVLRGGMDPRTLRPIGPGGSTLRDALAEVFKRHDYSTLESTEMGSQEYNGIVADVKDTIMKFNEFAKQYMSQDPEIIKIIDERGRAMEQSKKLKIPSVFMTPLGG